MHVTFIGFGTDVINVLVPIQTRHILVTEMTKSGLPICKRTCMHHLKMLWKYDKKVHLGLELDLVMRPCAWESMTCSSFQYSSMRLLIDVQHNGDDWRHMTQDMSWPWWQTRPLMHSWARARACTCVWTWKNTAVSPFFHRTVHDLEKPVELCKATWKTHRCRSGAKRSFGVEMSSAGCWNSSEHQLF